MKPMKSPLCPNDIEVLIYCHTRQAPHPRREAVASVITMFLEAGMIEPDITNHGDEFFRTTPKGAVFLTALCNTKEPVAKWEVPWTVYGRREP